MSGLSLGIVLVAAILHAFWNYLAKKSRNKIVFIWWFILIACILYAPMFLYFYFAIEISAVGWACIIATGILHALYFFFVGGSYERGDLSLAYPLARGFGPFLVPILAVILLREQLSPSGIAGIALVVIGIYLIHLRSFSWQSFFEPFAAIRGNASIWALLTGCTIAAYSLVDKVGVQSVHPPVYIYLMFVISLLLLTPYVLIKERQVLKHANQQGQLCGCCQGGEYCVFSSFRNHLAWRKPSAAAIDWLHSNRTRGGFYRSEPLEICKPIFHDYLL
jgi:drug/metabolite transporter (DMT)-like permease